jgi:hypothetical protein
VITQQYGVVSEANSEISESGTSSVSSSKPRDGRNAGHLNGDRLNDRRLYLPFVTAAESSANLKVHAASGYRGMHLTRADGRSPR